MSKITLIGKAIVITSAVKSATIKQLKKFSPASLVKKDDKGAPVYAIDLSVKGTVGISKNGITFNGTSKEGFAQATVLVPDGTATSAEYVVDNFGAALFELDSFETEVNAAYADLAAQIKAVESNITEA